MCIRDRPYNDGVVGETARIVKTEHSATRPNEAFGSFRIRGLPVAVRFDVLGPATARYSHCSTMFLSLRLASSWPIVFTTTMPITARQTTIATKGTRAFI